MTKNEFQKEGIFPIGEENTAFAQYFTGGSYLAGLVLQPVQIANVTFEPGCRNNWHTHHGGGADSALHSWKGLLSRVGQVRSGTASG